MQRRQLFAGLALGIGVLGLTLLFGWWQVDGPGATRPGGGRPLPFEAMEFSLTDHDGTNVGPQTLIGRPSMVFFGFTYCPDVCPTTLSDITGWLEEMGDEAERLNVIFITVDPERDTVEAIAEYVDYFHPAIRGWTGAPEQIARAAAGFGATYERTETEGGGYTMDHTSSVFLFDAKGEFVTMIDYHEPREVAVPKIRRALED